MSILSNTSKLQSLLDKVNSLPEADGSIPDSYLVENEIVEQDSLIAQIQSALIGKASGSSGSTGGNFAFGNFTPSIDSGIYTIAHNLGVIPNIVSVAAVTASTSGHKGMRSLSVMPVALVEDDAGNSYDFTACSMIVGESKTAGDISITASPLIGYAFPTHDGFAAKTIGEYTSTANVYVGNATENTVAVGIMLPYNAGSEAGFAAGQEYVYFVGRIDI